MRLSFWLIETHDGFFKVVVCEWSYGVTLEADFRDGLGPPVDDEEAVVAATHAHTRHRTTLQTLVADVTHEVQIARQTLDSWVTCAKKWQHYIRGSMMYFNLLEDYSRLPVFHNSFYQ